MMDDLRDQLKAWTDAAAQRNAFDPVQAEDVIGGDRSQPHRRPRRALASRLLVAAAVVAIVAVAVVVAWPTSTDHTVDYVLTANGDGSHGPGSRIVGGLTVLPGSELIGPTFPELPDPRGQTWYSLVRVTGDPVTVFRAYVDQLEAAGVEMSSDYCGIVPSIGGMPPVAERLECSAGGVESKPGSAFSSGFLTLVSPVGGNDDFATSLSLTVGIPDPDVAPTTLSKLERYYQSFPTTTAIPFTMPPTSALPEGLVSRPGPSLPTTGALVAPAWMDPGVGLRVVQGSTLLVPAAPFDGGSQGWVTIARLTGDPEQVMAAYLNQGNHGPFVQKKDTVEDGHRVLRRWWDATGGAKLFLTAMQDSSGTWFLRINVQND